MPVARTACMSFGDTTSSEISQTQKDKRHILHLHEVPTGADSWRQKKKGGCLALGGMEMES